MHERAAAAVTSADPVVAVVAAAAVKGLGMHADGSGAGREPCDVDDGCASAGVKSLGNGREENEENGTKPRCGARMKREGRWGGMQQRRRTITRMLRGGTGDIHRLLLRLRLSLQAPPATALATITRALSAVTFLATAAAAAASGQSSLVSVRSNSSLQIFCSRHRRTGLRSPLYFCRPCSSEGCSSVACQCQC
jgi:hypothetical protein